MLQAVRDMEVAVRLLEDLLELQRCTAGHHGGTHHADDAHAEEDLGRSLLQLEHVLRCSVGERGGKELHRLSSFI